VAEDPNPPLATRSARELVQCLLNNSDTPALNSLVTNASECHSYLRDTRLASSAVVWTFRTKGLDMPCQICKVISHSADRCPRYLGMDQSIKDFIDEILRTHPFPPRPSTRLAKQPDSPGPSTEQLTNRFYQLLLKNSSHCTEIRWEIRNWKTRSLRVNPEKGGLTKDAKRGERYPEARSSNPATAASSPPFPR
jgi:hypothetical protein